MSNKHDTGHNGIHGQVNRTYAWTCSKICLHCRLMANGKSFYFLKKSSHALRNIGLTKNIYFLTAVQPALHYYFTLLLLHFFFKVTLFKSHTLTCCPKTVIQQNQNYRSEFPKFRAPAKLQPFHLSRKYIQKLVP